MEDSQPAMHNEARTDSVVEAEDGQGGLGHDHVPHSKLRNRSSGVCQSAPTSLSGPSGPSSHASRSDHSQYLEMHDMTPAGGDDACRSDSTVTLQARMIAKGKESSSSFDQPVIRNASSQVQRASQELRKLVPNSPPAGASTGLRTDRFKTSATNIFKGPTFINQHAVWASVEKRFDHLQEGGFLHRSKFGRCIDMRELNFAGELFDALARRRNISGDSINKAELMEFWSQLSDQRSDTRLQPFFDMMDKDADGRVTEEDIKEIIMLSSSANKLSGLQEQAEEYARLIMAELDPNKHGYIETHKLERLLEESASASQWGPRASRGNDSSRTSHMMEKHSSSFDHAVIRNASSQVKQVAQELRRLKSVSQCVQTSAGEPIDHSKCASHTLKALEFINRINDGATGWPTVEKLFHKLSSNGLLHRSKFGQCIGIKELDFAGELFDALARRRNICTDCINKAELVEFWDQIYDQRFDSRVQTFIDMMDKSVDGRITEEEVKEIIMLSSWGNKMSEIQKNPEDAQGNEMSEIQKNTEEYARVIMEELDPNNFYGYIEPYNLQMMMMQVQSQSVSIRATSSGGSLVQMNRSLRQTVEPNLLRQWYEQVQYFLEDNWRRIWVMLLWLCICTGLFAWKFIQYRRHAVFHVMGSCICVAKGAAETLKFNMALILLPVCRNTITWIRGRTKMGRVVPLDDNIKFHEVIAVGVIIGAGMHVISHLTCGFVPRLVHATDAEYEPMKLFFGEKRIRNYRWFVTGTEGWTGLAMLVVMAIAFTLAMPGFRHRRLRLPGPLYRLTGFNAFWYSHHLFVVVYALLIVHGHGLYLTQKSYNKTTWMYLSIPMFSYACERFARVLRSNLRPVKILKVIIYPGNVVSLHLSKPHGFKYKSGQYILLNCAASSWFEWHPFHITSAPQDEHICIHMRTLGDWTSETRNVFSKVCHMPLPGQSGLLRAEDDRDSDTRFPKLMIDGPYGEMSQDYEQYEVVLLIGLGIGIVPMISIIKDISDKIKLHDNHVDVESGAVRRATTSFQTQRAYLYWITREQGSFEWFRSVIEEVAETDKKGAIELHQYCTSVYEEGDARSAFITMVNALSNDGVDVISGTRVKVQFSRPNWRAVYKRIALNHRSQRVGVFYCGAPVLTKQLRYLAQHFSRKTSTRFEFHRTNF